MLCQFGNENCVVDGYLGSHMMCIEKAPETGEVDIVRGGCEKRIGIGGIS